MRILVTGATGFVGGALARRLAARGDRVHALVRPGADRAELAGAAVVEHAGDLVDPASVRRAAAAAAADARAAGEPPPACVHAAAVISYRRGDGPLQRRVNVEGTRAVLDACRAEGLGRVVHVSSMVTVGFTRRLGPPLDEDAPYRGAELLCDYVTTKRAAEDFALAVADQLDVVAVCPGAIYGPSARLSNTDRFLSRLAAGGLGPVAPPGSLGVVGIDDVVDGILLALERGARGRRYLLVESSPTVLALSQHAARHLGVRGPRAAVPTPLWRLAVGALELPDRVRRLETATPQALRLLGVHWRLDAARARHELGWRPRPFDEVLAETVAHLRARRAEREPGGAARA